MAGDAQLGLLERRDRRRPARRRLPGRADLDARPDRDLHPRATAARPTLEDIGLILFRNSLVLALHAFACVAGFIALNSLPYSAAQRSGISRDDPREGRAIRDAVRRRRDALLARRRRPTSSAPRSSTRRGPVRPLATATCCCYCLPHAIPELTALFLPLAAWLIASRRGDWDQLLAATFVTVGVAVPTLLLSSRSRSSSSPS